MVCRVGELAVKVVMVMITVTQLTVLFIGVVLIGWEVWLKVRVAVHVVRLCGIVARVQYTVIAGAAAVDVPGLCVCCNLS